MQITFIADATKCTLGDSKKPKSQDDHILNYGIWIIQFGLIMMQLNDTENEGDGERAVRNCLFSFLGQVNMQSAK